MVSRRQFLGSSSLALAGAAFTGCRLSKDGSSEEPLPASLAALTSQADRARAITSEERQVRLDNATRIMTTQGMDAILLTGGTSLLYFTNVRWGLSERLFGVVIPRTGTPFAVCPAFEEERAVEQMAQGPLGKNTEVRTWEEHDNPYERVAAGLRERGLGSGSLGIEETVRFVYSDGISKAAPSLALTSATPVTAGCRAIKDAHEIELMRLASEVTLAAYAAAWEALEEGMTQGEFASLVSRAHSRLGFSGGAGVQVGEFSALPHGSKTPQTIREGTILLIDGGCAVEGYRSDISRTFVLGKATDKMKQVFDIELEAQTRALEAARPGVPCEDVDAAARKVIVDAGYGPDYAFFTHRVGHGIGMDGHEWPYLVRGNMLPLAPGMMFSDEPGIYIRGEFGMRLEDDMLITEDGAELLTPQSRSLEQPFA